MSIQEKFCIENKLKDCLKVIRCYDWLINCYVLDFYVDDQWSRLPLTWREFFADLPPEELCFLTNFQSDDKKEGSKRIWPLSFLALRQVFKELSIKRKQQSKEILQRSLILEHPKLRHVFRKGVKPKKRHELEEMASLCAKISKESPVDFVVDFGGGLGHLARVLGYAYGIKVCCLEMQTQLNKQAYEIDENMDKFCKKYLEPEIYSNCRKPEHIDLCLTAEMKPEEFLQTVEKALNISHKDYSFGIIGLHPCGDLGAILMRMFLKCEQATFLNFVGCCYMKLTAKGNSDFEGTKIHKEYGYPLSKYLRRTTSIKSQLSYEAREIACHAIELYNERLSLKDYEYLKVHSFRAAAERIIVRHYPEMKHVGLKSVKHEPEMEFKDYFYKAVKGLKAEQISPLQLCTAITMDDLCQWKNIVIFYTLRLFFAPLIESVLLYDRFLFLQENDCDIQINAIFDPRLSPRNHITTAVKSS